MKMIKYIFASLLAVASMAAHAQVFDVHITPSDGSEVFTKTNATCIEIHPGNSSPINVFSGESDLQGTSLTVSHAVRYDFALTPATTIKPGQDGGLPEGTFDANAPMRRTAEAPSFTEPELTGPALVLMREDNDPIIYYAKDVTDGPIILMCNPDGEYIVGATKVQGTVTAVFYKDAHTPVTDAAVAPTCTATGKTEGSHCSVCEEVLVAQQEVAALGHDWKETETYLKSEATCSANAVFYKECDRCHAQGTDTWTKTGTATGNHSFNREEDATRSECSVCHHGFFRYTSENNAAVSPRVASNLKDADGNTLTIISNGYVEAEGKCVMEFSAPLDTIGQAAFINCTGFTGNLVIPNSVTNIGFNAFYNCKGFTGSLTIGNSVTSIGEQAFTMCSGFKGNLTIGNSVITIGKNAFVECSGFTGNLVIPNSVTSIGAFAFQNCSGFDGSLTIGNSVASIGAYAFFNCKGFTGSLTIPNSVTSIGEQAFNSCSGFTGDLIIPNSVTSIGASAFFNCKGFDGKLVIPASVTSIGAQAFVFCDSLTSVYDYATTPQTHNFLFYNTVYKNRTLYVPSTSVQTYRNTNGWNSFQTIRCIEHGEIETDAAVEPTCVMPGKTAGSHCSACGEVIVAQAVIPATGIHSDADNDNFCDVCGIWVSFEEPVLVTAENYEALGLDSKYVGYWAIGNLKQLAFVSSYFHGAMYKADRVANITYDGDAPARRKAMRQAVADAQSQSIKFVLTSDITVNENLFNADGKINIYDTRGNLRSDLLAWFGLGFEEQDQSGNLIETVFDGNGHAIRGIYQNFDFEGLQCGFASSISSGCTICNLGISQSYFRSVSSSNAGSIVAYSEGSIDNCWSDAVIECTNVENVGGLVGKVFSQGLIKDSYFTGSISTNGRSTNTGGIVGNMLICDYCSGRIENCHFSGRISASDERPSASGIVCRLSTGIYSSLATIDKCYADGELILNNNACFGGIAQYANGKVLIYNCYNDMKLSNAGNCCGAGIVYYCDNSNCSIQYCFNYATYPGGVVFNPIVYVSYESNIYNCVCCYTLGESDDYSESATVEDFANGKIAYYLNDDYNENPELIVWFQKLGKDKYPVLKGDRYSIVYKDDETQTFYNEMRKMASYTIADGATYDLEYEYLVDALTYSRTIKDNQVDKWQALYVPFQMAYDDWKDTYEVAAINNFHEYYDANGNIEGRDLEIRLVKSGKTRANYPYLIRPKSAGKKDIVIENTTLYPAESNSISCASTDTRYTFTGTYQPIARIDTDSLGYIFMGGGQLSQTSNHNAVLGAQRWYLQVEEYDSMTDAFKPIEPLSSSMRVVLLDEEETGINEIENGELKMENSIYNLQGQRLNEVQKGLNIVRGRNGENKKLIVE